MYLLSLGVLIILAILLFIMIIVFLLFSGDLFFEIPYVSTSEEKVKTMMQLAKIKEGETVVDLGSGDGRLLLATARAGASAVGYELNPLLIIITNFRKITNRLSRKIEVKSKNLWEADLKKADVIFVYGRKKTMKRFEDFVFQNAKKGARVLVNSEKTISFPTKKPANAKNGIYLYKI